MTLPTYIDIDGTLTDTPHGQWGAPFEERLRAVRGLIEIGREVVIWSGGGTSYAKAFADKHGLSGAVCVGKPGLVVDDNPDIRPHGRMSVIPPIAYFGS